MNPVDTMDTMKMDPVGLEMTNFRCLPSQFAAEIAISRGRPISACRRAGARGRAPLVPGTPITRPDGSRNSSCIHGYRLVFPSCLLFDHEPRIATARRLLPVVVVCDYVFYRPLRLVLSPPCQAPVAERSPYCSARLNLHI